MKQCAHELMDAAQLSVGFESHFCFVKRHKFTDEIVSAGAIGSILPFSHDIMLDLFVEIIIITT